jgi:molybdate transport system substrate-binding protein
MSRFGKMGAWAFIALAMAAASCQKENAPAVDGKWTPETPLVASSSANTVILSAAASTKEAIEAVTQKFHDETGIEVKVNLGGSNTLAAQILAGAPADLFLSANQKWADEVKKAGSATSDVRLLTNGLVIVVPAGNPAGVNKPDDLLSDKVKKIALAGEKVPAGMYADQALEKLGLLKQLTDAGKIVRGQDVRNTLSYVERGEVEAGIVYSTDVSNASGTTAAYNFDPSTHDEIAYVLVLLQHGNNNPSAKKLFDYLQSPAADAIYSKFGFSRLPH